METLIGTVLGYMVSSIKKSKGAEKASGEMSSAIWQWVRPIFLKDVEEQKTLKKLEEQPEVTENQNAAAQTIKGYLEKNPEQVSALEALVEKTKAQYPERMGDVINYGNVTKQVNNPIIKGDLNM